MAQTLEIMIAAALARDADRRAFEFAGEWHTWGDIHAVAKTVLALLDASGAACEAPVMLAPRTRPAAVAALLALTGAGRRVRLAYAFQSAARLLDEIDTRRPAALIACSEDFSAELVSGLRARGIAGIALDAKSASAIPGLEHSTALAARDLAPRHLETLTSGTTGKPKPFLVPFGTISEHLVRKSAVLGGSVDDKADAAPIFLSVPLANISGIYGIFPTAISGHPVVLADRFTIPEWLSYVKRYRPGIANLPTSMVQQVVDLDLPAEDLASITAITTGAAPIDPAAHRAFEARYGIPILLAYGATEFVGSIAQMTPELHREWGAAKFGSAGRAAPGAEMRIVDPATGEVLPAGTEGLLEARTDRLGSGWIRTSDLAVIDADGFLFHRGRADCAIVRGGFKILPETIEQALMLHPAVSAAIAAGVDDRRLGRVPGVVICPASGQPRPTVMELEAHLRRHLLATQIPARWLLVDEMPMTLSHKLDRKAAQALLAAAAP